MLEGQGECLALRRLGQYGLVCGARLGELLAEGRIRGALPSLEVNQQLASKCFDVGYDT